MTRQDWRDKVGEFTLLSPEEGTRFSDVRVSQPLPSVRIIEDGAVRCVVEAVFGYEDSRAVIRYKLSRCVRQIDMDIRVINLTKTKMIKLRLPQALPDAAPALEVAFGEEPMKDNGKECVGHTYLTVTGSDGARLNILNRGIYGSSFDRDSGNIYLTLLRSPGYTAHPLGPDRPVMPTDRWSEHMEQGERQFAVRLTAGSAGDSSVARAGLAFNESPMVLSFFPSGEHAQSPAPGAVPYITLSGADNAITMTALKHTADGKDTLIRLFNPTDIAASCTLSCPAASLYAEIAFTPFEVKTFRIKGDRLVECRMDEIAFENE